MRLIVHIGVGKAGMTAIQTNLSASRSYLRVEGVEYWGTMLEKARVSLYDWQQPRAFHQLRSLPVGESHQQLYEVLEQSLQAARSAGMKTAIWSYEGLIGRAQLAVPVLERLRDAGFDISVVVCLRRYDSWLRSAYTQWGIKHKNYRGPVKSFREFADQRPIRFGQQCSPWESAFGDDFIMLNVDAAGDIVPHFMQRLGLPAIEKPSRANESPHFEELLLRSIHGHQTDGGTSPREFNRLISVREIDFDFDGISWLNENLPSDEDVEKAVEGSHEDLEKINILLRQKGEPELASDVLPGKEFSVSRDRLLSICFQMLLNQAREINRLRESITDSFGHQEGDSKES